MVKHTTPLLLTNITPHQHSDRNYHHPPRPATVSQQLTRDRNHHRSIYKVLDYTVYDNLASTISACCSFHLDKSGIAEVSQRSLRGWYPILYRALIRNTRTRVGNQVIIHIVIRRMMMMMLGRGSCLLSSKKLSKILRDIENRSKGMPLSKKMDLMRVAVMLFTQQEHPDIHQGIRFSNSSLGDLTQHLRKLQL